MSIPKEPRQLMINLMYLVLTAMLALNVSAEIINAFFSLNKGIKESNTIVDGSNKSMKDAIDKQIPTNPTLYQQYKAPSDEVVKISKDFEAYMSGITNELVTMAGGPNPKYADGRPIRYKDKDVTTNLFLSGGKNLGRGVELEKKIKETRDAFIATIKDPKEREKLIKMIPLQVEEVPADAKAKTWVDLKFKQMPVAAVMPSLTKLVADAKTSETALLNYFMDKVSGKLELKLDKFLVAISPKKAYLIRGDKFEADVALGAYSSNPGQGLSISVNGQGLSIVNGVGHYEASPNSLGKQTITAVASITNPATGLKSTAEGKFEYEVGEKSVTVSAEKMNVFYIGVENPIEVSAAGASSNSLKVSLSSGDIRKKDANNYVVTVSRPGECIVTVTGDGGLSATKKFRIKAIPDPVPVLALGSEKDKKGGPLPTGIIQSLGGIIAELKNFDFDAKCSIQSYVLVHVPRRDDPRQANVTGPINGEAQRLLGQAKPGDSYSFMNIKARCPGDVAARDIGGINMFAR
jgi:gliding motility-associated protein GldM